MCVQKCVNSVHKGIICLILKVYKYVQLSDHSAKEDEEIVNYFNLALT